MIPIVQMEKPRAGEVISQRPRSPLSTKPGGSPSPCQGWKDTVYVPKQDLQRNDASSFVENLKFFISMQVLRSLL